MKVAVCVSGKFESARDLIISNNSILKDKFCGADFYYATWDYYKDSFLNTFPTYECFYFQEPEIEYHPYKDINPKNYISARFKEAFKYIKKKKDGKGMEWSSHHTKQIIIHSWLADLISGKYDIVIRTRFDARIWEEANFESYISDSYKNNRTIGFATTRHSMFNKIYESTKGEKKSTSDWLLDQLIIHPANFINRKTVEELDRKKILHPAEMGWYQVLSMPYGSRHRNMHGWVNHDRNIPEIFIK